MSTAENPAIDPDAIDPDEIDEPQTADGCSPASVARGESLAGTASGIRSFLLVEHDGPWGTEVLTDTRLPAPLLARLRRGAGRAGVRVLMIRRYRRRRGPASEAPQVFAAHVRPGQAWCESIRLDGYDALGEIDLAPIGQGERPGWDDHPEPVFAVCTHGRHDACCASYGRGVAEAMAEALPDHTWECSHLGGDRFAANMLTLPYGFYFGRLQPETAADVGRKLIAGDLELDHLRGRSWFATPVQAAEIAIRRATGRTGVHDLRFVWRDRLDGGITRCRFAVADQGEWIARIATTTGEPARLTCRAVRENPPPIHTVTDVGPVG